MSNLFEGRLNRIYDFVKQYYMNKLANDYIYDDGVNRAKFALQAFNYMVNLCGYFDKPRVVEDDVYKNFKSIELYRGVSKAKHHKELLNKPKNYYPGVGMFGYGIYFASIKNDALYYASNSRRKVMKCKISSPNIITSEILTQYRRMIYKGKTDEKFLQTDVFIKFNTLNYELNHEDRCKENWCTFDFKDDIEKIKKLNEFIENIKFPEIKDLYKEIFVENVSNIAILLGYDLIQVKPNFTFFSLLNRSKIVVSKKEYNRLSNLSLIDKLEGLSKKDEFVAE